jgi:hypothetical protein
MSLVPLDLPPGIYRNGTRYQTKARWFDANLIRWVEGIMQPIGGWSKVTTNPINSIARSMLAWSTNSGARWLAVGTPSQLFVTRADGVMYDVTPIGFIPGPVSPTEQLGYGGGNYGVSTYGTARQGGTYIAPGVWQLDTWGDYLVGCQRSDGRIFQWTLNQGAPASPIIGAPGACAGLIVSDQRHMLAFGPGANLKKVQWSDKENNTLWTPAATNEAGSFEFQSAGEYVRAVRMKGQILVLFSVDAHVMQYIGQPYIYRRERIGTNCGLIGPNAVALAGSEAFWMSDQQFWTYAGGSVQQLPCDVLDYVFGNINRFQSAKIACGYNSAYNEVWWWYPSANSTENDRYVIYNTIEKHWSIGSMSRTAWADRGVFPNPLAMGSDNNLYRHEQGWTDAGSTRYPLIYAESGALELNNGDQTASILQVVTDEKTRGATQLKFETRFTPNGQAYNFGPYLVRSDGYTDARLSGRQVVMRVEPTLDDDFRIGQLRLDIKPGGNR